MVFKGTHTSNVDVSVIIVNYKTSSLVAKCIQSIYTYTQGVNYELIIVDNNSEPDFKDIIESEAGLIDRAPITFISLPENIGFGRANNVGVKSASGRYIFFLNPDTLLLNNAIAILAEFLDRQNDVGACGGNLYSEEMKGTTSFKRFFPGIKWEINELLHYYPQRLIYGDSSYFNPSKKPLEVAYISGADLMVRKSLFDTIGGFSDKYFMYFEETDLCYRIRKKGWKIFSVPEARIQHLESKSFSPSAEYQSEFKTRLLEESRNKFYQQNKSHTEKLFANYLYDIFLKSRICLLPAGKKKEYYKNRRFYFKNTLL